MHMLRIMSNPSNIIKKREKLQSKGGATARKNIRARHAWNGHRAEQKRAESERECSTKRPDTGA